MIWLWVVVAVGILSAAAITTGLLADRYLTYTTARHARRSDGQ